MNAENEGLAATDGTAMALRDAPFRSVAPQLREEIEGEVHRADFPAASQELHDALVARSAAEARVATLAAVEQDAPGDRETLAELQDAKTTRRELATLASSVDQELWQFAEAATQLPTPMSESARRRLCCAVLCSVLLLLAGMAALFGLTLDSVVRPVLDSGRGFAPAQAPLGISSLAWSMILGAAVASLNLLKTAVTFGAPRWVRRGAKAGFVGVDLLASAALAALRGRHAMAGPGIGISLVEAGMTLMITVGLSIVAKALSEDDERARACTCADARVGALRSRLLMITAARDALSRAISEQINELSLRAASVLSEDRRVALSEATAHAAYVVATSRLIAASVGAVDENLPNRPAAALLGEPAGLRVLEGGRHA